MDDVSTSSEPRPLLATLDLALLRGALEEIPFGIATTRGGAIFYANEALARIYGVPHGALEHKQVSQLFDAETNARITQRLDEARVFDGRVRTTGFDGRTIDAEIHIEWYSSEAQGVGGFLVVRDISLEMGALGRLVDQLGAAQFRVRVLDAAIEFVSPAIVKLTGIDAATCMQRPVLLTALASAEERERVVFLYRRMARGEIPMASAQVSLRRHDGATRVLQLRATARRDTGGVVRHIDGVVSDAARETEGVAYGHLGLGHDTRPPRSERHDDGSVDHEARQRPRADDASALRDPLARATMELSNELLREGSQHLHTLGRELRGVRAGLKTHAAALPPGVAEDLCIRLETAAFAVAGGAALNRGVRRVLARAVTMGAPVSEVLEGARATLVAVIGVSERVIVADAGDAATLIIPERVDELSTALVYLALRAFRFSGSGTLRLSAHRARPAGAGAEPPPSSGAPSSDRRGRSRHSRPPPEPEHLVIEILGVAPPDLTDSAVGISSDVLRTVPRPAEADVTYQAAQTLIAAAGGSVESDDTTFSTARSVIRLRL